jgi:hypothetical protein
MVATFMAGRFKLLFTDFLKSAHQLWLEVIGGIFLCFAAVFGLQAFRYYQEYVVTPDNPIWLIASSGLALLTLGFGIHSFWKSRKLR